MKRAINNLYYWILDYIYVLKQQLKTVVDRSSTDKYRSDNGLPILLIPGIYENWRFMQPIARLLHAHGYDVHVIEGLGYNRGTIEQMSAAVQSYIIIHKLSHVILVAHSKGGLIGKYLLSQSKNTKTIDGLVAMNTPFSGSKYAYFLPLKSLRMFIPNSEILLSLAKDRLVNDRIVSIYGRFDPHIPGGSKLDGAKNIQLEAYGHFRILDSKVVHTALIKGIETIHQAA